MNVTAGFSGNYIKINNNKALLMFKMFNSVDLVPTNCTIGHVYLFNIYTNNSILIENHKKIVKNRQCIGILIYILLFIEKINSI